MNKFNITKELLIDLYFGKGMSQSQIASVVGCNQALISYRMREFKIETRSNQDNFALKGHPMKGKENKWGTHTEEWKKENSKRVSGSNNPMYGKSLSEETKEKLSKRFSGSGNPMYGKRGKEAPGYKNPDERINTLYEQIRGTIEVKNWTSACMARDSYTCQKCGDRKGGNLNVHHIKHLSEIVKQFSIKTKEEAVLNKEILDLKNGITLCKECHKIEHKKN